MADEVGLVLVGPAANALELDPGLDVPILRVRAEAILPLEEDLSAMVGYAASGTFHGPDADRFDLLDEASALAETEMLWACAQVQSAGIAQAAGMWERVLVVGWADEPALIPAVRALTTLKRPLSVLLGGELESLSKAATRRNHLVLADLLRSEAIVQGIHNPDPSAVLDIALDAARNPQRRTAQRVKPVDVGPALDLAPTWCMPAAPVSFYELIHVGMGHASGLSEVAVDVAAWKSLNELFSGPPVDIGGSHEGTGARGRLPDGDVHTLMHGAITKALDAVVFTGDEPLVEQLGRELRPVLKRIGELLDAVRDVERARLSGVRAFTAAGIQYTVQSLSARLDAIRDPYPSELIDELVVLLRGEAGSEGPVHITEWKRAFAGIPSCVVPRGSPGAAVARKLVVDRYALFKAEYAAGVAERVDRLCQRARDTESPPSTTELRALRQRAERVRDALQEALARLDERIDRQCEQAVRDDRFVRWSCPDAPALRQLLLNRVSSLPLAAELDKLAVDALSSRALGMADDQDFETYLGQLARDVHGLAGRARDVQGWVPTYETVLLLLLQGRDPPVLRQAIARSASTEVELHLERPVEPALMNWLTATGMLVVVAPRLKTCAIYWQRAETLSDPAQDHHRKATTEHRLSDLILPPPEGDTVASLVSLVRSAVTVVVALVLGEVRVVRREGLAVHELTAPSIDLPPRTVLPHGVIHFLATDPERLAKLRRRVERRITELPLQRDARETTKKLVELATLGPSPTLSAQLGLYGARFEHLEHPINALLQQHAEQAVVAMVDCLDALELGRVALPPQRRVLLDVQQLGPSIA